MKRVSEFLMNKYFIIAFPVVVFGLRLFCDKYDISGKHQPFIATAKTVFLVSVVACFVHVLSFFVFVLLTKDKSEPWWETLENKPDGPGENLLLNTYAGALVVTIPFAVYGILIYLAAFTSWQNILACTIAFAITRIINYFQNRKKLTSQRGV
jgi:hypothetical protein